MFLNLLFRFSIEEFGWGRGGSATWSRLTASAISGLGGAAAVVPRGCGQHVSKSFVSILVEGVWVEPQRLCHVVVASMSLSLVSLPFPSLTSPSLLFSALLFPSFLDSSLLFSALLLSSLLLNTSLLFSSRLVSSRLVSSRLFYSSLI